MKQTWLARLALVPALALLLAGCRGGGNQPEKVTTATGTYKGQTITLSLTKETDFVAGEDFLFYNNGYMTFLDITNTMEAEQPEIEYSCLDVNGKKLFTINCDSILPVNQDGVTYARLEDGTCVRVNLNGDQTEISEDEYFEAEMAVSEKLPWEQNYSSHHFEETENADGTYSHQLIYGDGTAGSTFIAKETEEVKCITDKLVTVGYYDGERRLFDITGKQLHDKPFDSIGYFYNGLAPFWQDGKMGLLGDDGSIVIPATFPHTPDALSTIPFNEDILVLTDSVEFTITLFKVTRG